MQRSGRAEANKAFPSQSYDLEQDNMRRSSLFHLQHLAEVKPILTAALEAITHGLLHLTARNFILESPILASEVIFRDFYLFLNALLSLSEPPRPLLLNYTVARSRPLHCLVYEAVLKSTSSPWLINII